MNHQQLTFLQNRVAYIRDEQAYKQLFYHFYPLFFRFIKGILKDTETAEEVVSDVLLKIWTMQNRLAYIEKLDVYLLKAAKNATLNKLKEKNRAAGYTDDYIAVEEIEEPLCGETPEQRLIHSETEKIINKTVAALPLQCQMVYRLIREEGLSHKKVSDILEVSSNTIETHMRNALKKIRSSLQEYLQSDH